MNTVDPMDRLIVYFACANSEDTVTWADDLES